MTAQGEDVLAWLEAVIARHEKRATLAAVSLAGSPRGGNWDQCRDEHHGGCMVRRSALRPGATTPPMTDAVPDRVAFVFGESGAAHIVANDPESVLRRCAADRKLLELHAPQQDGSPFPDAMQCRTCSKDGGDGYQYLIRFPCATVLAIAEGYGWTESQR